MLVEINLLPKKERKSMLALVISVLVVSLLFFSTVGMFYYYTIVKEDLNNLNIQLDQKKALRIMHEKTLQSQEGSASIEDLENKINWVENQRISTVLLLTSFVERLPERGFFMDYQFNEDGKLSIEVQFDTTRQASNYLYQLTQLPFVIDVEITGIVTDQLEDVAENYNYLPRYFATYEIEIDYNLVKVYEED